MASGKIQSFVPIISKIYSILTSGTEITFLSPNAGLYLIYALVTNASYGSFWMAYLNLNNIGYNSLSTIWSNSYNAAITINVTAPGELTIKTTVNYVNLLIFSFASSVEIR